LFERAQNIEPLQIQKRIIMSAKKYLRVKLIKSTNKALANHKACVQGLGLRRVGQVCEVIDTPENRGMINKAYYMLEVTESKKEGK
jgi:large subunit ribosomal protein L30